VYVEVELPHDNDDDADDDDTPRRRQARAVTPHIAREVLRLSDELHLGETEALALYVAACALQAGGGSHGHDGEDGDVMATESEGDGGREDDDYDDDDDGFVQMLIEGGMVGFRTQSPPEPSTSQPPQFPSQPPAESPRPSRTLRTARRLFFRERSALLSAIHEVIRHRVEAADRAGRQNDGRHGGDREAMLVATDPLLKAGLVTNLIKTIRELTASMEGLARGLRAEEEERRRRRSAAAANANANANSNAAWNNANSNVAGGPSSSTGGFGGFGTSHPVGTDSTTTPSVEKNLDMEYALLSFAGMQRHIAAECLFYLAYHAQWTAEEVASTIDLIRDLTNGSDVAGGVGGGLPRLDPLVEDVPPVYGEVPMMTATTASVQGFMSQQHPQQPWQTWNVPVPKLKDPKEWEEEWIANLWGKGQPSLLQCVSTLIMTVMCALDARQVLMDRETHGPNSFGAGNALLPPHSDTSDPSMNGLQPIHTRLDPENKDTERQWKRCDIWGVLFLPYALLLRNSVVPLTSPRGSGSVPSPLSPDANPRTRGTMDAAKTFTDCLTAASQYKSLTFARLSLLPSLGLPSTRSHHKDVVSMGRGDDVSIFDFYISVLAECTAQFMDVLCASGNLPITQQMWFDEENNTAQVEWKRVEEKNYYDVLWGKTVVEDASGPREVDILDRPDCLEDVFALVSSVCSASPESSKAFWKIVEEELELTEDGSSPVTTFRLAPSRCMRLLETKRSDNDSTLLVFLSFLASLALSDGVEENDTDNGASMVHSFLSGEKSINAPSDRHAPFTWSNAISAIRWYAEELSPEVKDEGSKRDRLRRSPTTTTDTVPNPTSYYYGVGDDTESNDRDEASTPNDTHRSQSSSSSSSKGKTPSTKELDEVGKNALTSLLSLISNVAARCPAAREYILDIQLPVPGTDGVSDILQDGCLEILFSLLTTEIPPDIRGLTFMAIANLLQSKPGDTGKSPMGKKAWELMECCQFVPVKYLSRYSSFAAGAGSAPSMSMYNRNQPRDDGDVPNSYFPKTADYGMIYIFEHVEGVVGSYPATEGFLYLLTTLIKVAGCPSDLGSHWRLRPGCSPYIEYVTDFILPRASGTARHVKPLPFLTVADEGRLTSRALEVVEAVLVRYVVPLALDRATLSELRESNCLTMKAANEELGLSSNTSAIFCPNDSLDEDDADDFSQDFNNICLYPQNVDPGSQMLEVSYGEPVSLPKTPGFFILSSLLSTSKGQLLQIIQKLISENGGSRDIQSFYGKSVMSKLLAIALFRETPPSFSNSREYNELVGRQQRNQLDDASCKTAMTYLLHSMIQQPSPAVLDFCFEDAFSFETTNCAPDDAVLWRERSLLLSMRILCAAAAREEPFNRAIKHSPKQLSVVPTLLFKGPIHGSYSHRFAEEQKVNTARLSQILTKGSTGAHGWNYSFNILPIIVEHIGYSACSLSNPQGIALNAFCLTSYISQTMPQEDCLRLLCGTDVCGIRLSRSFSRGLSEPPREDSSTCHLSDVILDMILNNIGQHTESSLNLSLMMLGLNGSKQNCLNVILDLINSSHFILSQKTSSSASKCFEIVFRVCELTSLSPPVQSQRELFLEKIRKIGFWEAQIFRFLGTSGPLSPSILHEVSLSYHSEHDSESLAPRRGNNVLHSVSWLLKGAAIELRALAELNRPSQFISLVDTLLSPPVPLLQNALLDLPLGQSRCGAVGQIIHNDIPSKDIVDASSVPLPGPVDVCSNFHVIDIEKMQGHFGDEYSLAKERATKWAHAWNKFVSRVCAFSHISEAWSDFTMAMLIFSRLVSRTNEHNGIINMLGKSRVVTEILCTTLLRLTHSGHLKALGPYAHISCGNNSFYEGDMIEAECGFPLSNAVLTLTEYLVESTLENMSNVHDNSHSYILSEEDAGRISALIVGAISSCSESGAGMSPAHDRCAILSYALARILTFSKLQSYCIVLQHNPSTILEIYTQAATLLFDLASWPVFSSQDRYTNLHEAKRGTISIAARSGLSSLFGYLNSFDRSDSFVQSFASKFFSSAPVIIAVSQLVHLISIEDSDVAYILQQIALLHHDGIQLIAKSGVTRSLLSFANTYTQEEARYLSSHLGANGNASLNPPTTLCGHLSLLIVLLASNLSIPDRLALSFDSYQLLSAYSRAGERLLQSYPSDIDLTKKFIETMCFTYSSIKKSSGSSGIDNSSLGTLSWDSTISGLERSILCLTYQLSAYPFPNPLLPPLPMGLVQVEKIHSSQMRNISVNIASEKTWWDSIPIFNPNDLPLPNPSTGSADAAIYQRSSLSQTAWSEGKYKLANSSAKCLEVSIMFLMSRVHFFNQKNAFKFSFDAVAIAKGLCRCSDASRAIEERLHVMKSHPEDNITKMLNASHVFDRSLGYNVSESHAMELERNYLVELGSSLGNCAEKLTCLALQDARRMMANLTSMSESGSSYNQSTQELAYFCGAITPALEHTQIETKGVGCAFTDNDKDSSKAMAQALRKELEKMTSLLRK